MNPRPVLSNDPTPTNDSPEPSEARQHLDTETELDDTNNRMTPYVEQSVFDAGDTGLPLPGEQNIDWYTYRFTVANYWLAC